MKNHFSSLLMSTSLLGMSMVGILLFITPSVSATQQKDLLAFIEDLSNDITDVYVIEAKIPDILEQLNRATVAVRSGEIQSTELLAQKLTETLTTIDKHFTVSVRSSAPPFDEAKLAEENKLPYESYWEKLERKNSGIQSVEVLKGNVGYINFIGFDRVNSTSRKRVANAMALVKGVDSMIIDLRTNGGGSPDMVALLAGYFVSEEIPMSSIYNREDDSTMEFESTNIRRKYRLIGVNLFVLTSLDSFSAAEAFAYDMKHYNLATIVGEVTGGGANPIRHYRYSEGFEVAIPYAMAINPVTNANWEGKGVQPNINAASEEALEEAYCLALMANQRSSKHLHLLSEITQLIEDKKCL